MQVFSMHYDYHQTAKELDYRRLGKQRVESWQILNTIQKKKNGLTKAAWINHPCIKIWYDCELALVNYSIAICEEWIRRGYKDTMLDRFLKMKDVFEHQCAERIFGICAEQEGYPLHQYNIEGEYLSRHHEVVSGNIETFNKHFLMTKGLRLN